MSQQIERLLDRFSLNDGEKEVVGNVKDDNLKERWCLIGRVLSSKPLNFRALSGALSGQWRTQKFILQEGEDGRFICEFQNRCDRDRVLRDGPWVFQRNMIVLAAIHGHERPSDIPLTQCPFWIQIYDLPINQRNVAMVTSIGSSLGAVIQVTEAEACAIGVYVRVRVNFDVNKPLIRRIRVRNSNDELIWIYFRYERLPTYCYRCGMLGHNHVDCNQKPEDSEVNGEWPYGPFLRPSPAKMQSTVCKQSVNGEEANGGQNSGQRETELYEIENEDIICFQKSPSVESEEDCRYPDKPSLLEYVQNYLVVHFRSLEKPKDDDFCLELSKVHTYDDVVERVALQIGLDDPSKLRLTSHNCCSQQPMPLPVENQGVENLSDMLAHYNQTSDILYYEVLDIPLPELLGLKNLQVAFHHSIKDEVVIHNLRLPKQSTVGDVINELKMKVDLSHPNAELRLLEVSCHKIYKIFPSNEKIENINGKYSTLRAEEIPEEEKNLGPRDRLIHVYHFTKGTPKSHMLVHTFGEPFFLVIHEVEFLVDIKLRLQKKLKVPDEEFSKWKFAYVSSLGRPVYLQDYDLLISRFQIGDRKGAWEQYLGLEHSDSEPKRLMH